MQFEPDRQAYIRSHTTMAAIAMAAAMALLWLMGNPHVWTGAVAGLAAVALRGWYVMDEAMAEIWTLEGARLSGPGARHVPLAQIAKVRTLGSAVQVITLAGDKHLIKYQSDPQAVGAQITRSKNSMGHATGPDA